MTSKEYNAEYYKKNKERLKAKQKLHYENVIKTDEVKLEKCRRNSRRWKSNNKEINSIRKLEWAAENKDKIIASAKQRRDKIKHLKEKVKKYYGCMNPNCICKNLPSYCLDFHHIDNKKFNLGNTYRSAEAIINEMAKCTIICAICHRMETWGDLDASKFPRCDAEEISEIVSS